MTRIETTHDVVRFSCLQALLKGAGIRAEGHDSPDGFSGTVNRHELLVRDEDAERALSLIADFDRSLGFEAVDEA